MKACEGLDTEDKGQTDLFLQICGCWHVVEGGAYKARVTITLIAAHEVSGGERWGYARSTSLEDHSGGGTSLNPVILNHLWWYGEDRI